MNETVKHTDITWTISDLARNLKVSMPTAYAMTEEPGFPLLRVGRKKLVIVSGLERWMFERAANHHKDKP